MGGRLGRHREIKKEVFFWIEGSVDRPKFAFPLTDSSDCPFWPYHSSRSPLFSNRMKGQALTDLLGVGAHPLQENSKLQKELPDEAVYCAEVASRPTSKAWEMYFDCASKTDEKGRLKSGVGIVFIITPKGNMIPHSFTLSESCSNNVSEYTALIMGMELARDIKVHQLEVRGN